MSEWVLDHGIYTSRNVELSLLVMTLAIVYGFSSAIISLSWH